MNIHWNIYDKLHIQINIREYARIFNWIFPLNIYMNIQFLNIHFLKKIFMNIMNIHDIHEYSRYSWGSDPQMLIFVRIFACKKTYIILLFEIKAFQELGRFWSDLSVSWSPNYGECRCSGENIMFVPFHFRSTLVRHISLFSTHSRYAQ